MTNPILDSGGCDKLLFFYKKTKEEKSTDFNHHLCLTSKQKLQPEKIVSHLHKSNSLNSLDTSLNSKITKDISPALVPGFLLNQASLFQENHKSKQDKDEKNFHSKKKKKLFSKQKKKKTFSNFQTL